MQKGILYVWSKPTMNQTAIQPAIVPSAGSNCEEAREARARAWAFVFECWHAKQEGGSATAPDECRLHARKGDQNGLTRNAITGRG
jgi:hypothetical protein